MRHITLSSMVFFLTLSACTTDVDDSPRTQPIPETKVETSEPPAKEKAERPPPSLPQKDPDAAPLKLRFEWPELSITLQQSFSDIDVLNPFYTELSDYLYGDVPLRVEMHPIPGSVRVEMGLELEQALFLSLTKGGEGWIAAQNFAPLLSALARYRNGVANRNDLRVFSFQIFVASGQCRFYSAANDPTVSEHQTAPCMKLNGKEYCGAFDDRGLTLPKNIFAGPQSCF